MRPRVPSCYTSIQFSNVGYRRSVFNFKIEPLRETSVSVVDDGSLEALTTGVEYCQTFTATKQFNKVGLHTKVSPFKTKTENQLTITLLKSNRSGWEVVSKNWYSNVIQDQWIWVNVDKYLPPDCRYMVTVTDVHSAPNETINLCFSANDMMTGGCRSSNNAQTGDYALQVMDEKIRLIVETVYNPDNINFKLTGTRAGTNSANLGGELMRLATTLDPDESVILGPCDSHPQ